MSKKLTVAETYSLIDRTLNGSAQNAPMIPEVVTQAFETAGGNDLQPDNLGARAKGMLEFYKPILEQTDWINQPEHDPRYTKRYETAKKMLACHAMTNALRRGPAAMKSEATTAGLDLPTFTRQLLMTVSRAFAKLFAPELFAVVPLTGPTGRINFKKDLYDSSLSAGGSPTVAAGDKIDDITKFNPNYYLAPEGQQAKAITFQYGNLDVSVKDYRVFAQWTDSLADDAMAVYDDDAERHLVERMSTEMARVWDRSMIAAVIAGYNTANQEDFTQFPTTNPNYNGLSPSEQEHYDQRLYRITMVNLFKDIAVTRRYNDDGTPTWAIIGTTFSTALESLSASTFSTYQRADQVAGQTGALRDYGTLKGMNIRFLVDPMLGTTVSGGAAHAYFGSTPTERDGTGIKLCPFIALQQTRDRYDPENGMTTKGVRSRFAIAAPTSGDSTILGDIYGRARLV